MNKDGRGGHHSWRALVDGLLPRAIPGDPSETPRRDPRRTRRRRPLEHFFRTPYLNAPIRESMRYNTPTNVTVPRVSDAPLNIGGHLVPPHTPVAFNMCAAHHNEAVWDAPAAFTPERWLADPCGGEEAHWVSFGLGPRRCPARNFSLYEQRVLLSMLVREYRWALPADSMHRDFLKNGSSAFVLSTPEKVDIDFVRIRADTSFTPL